MQLSFDEFTILKKSLKVNTKTNVLSDSMEPFIGKGEEIEVSPIEFNQLEVGDVIVFWNDRKLICHLVMKLNFEHSLPQVITKGLNSKKYDKPVLEEFFLGKVSKPKLGKIKKMIFKMMMKFQP